MGLGEGEEAGLSSVPTKTEEELESTSPTSALRLLASVTNFFFLLKPARSSQTSHLRDESLLVKPEQRLHCLSFCVGSGEPCPCFCLRAALGSACLAA